MSNISRGLRNNNPFNLRLSANQWQGLCNNTLVFYNATDDMLGSVYEVELNVEDSSFCQFQSLAFGLRAGMILLRTYIQNHGCNTVSKIINRFAPPSENNTQAYISFVCKGHSKDINGVLKQDTPISVGSREFFIVASRICFYESRLWIGVGVLERVYERMIVNFNLF